MKTEEEIKYLRSQIAILEKEDREKWVTLKNDMTKARESICVAHGGHFYYEPVVRFQKMAIGYEYITSQECKVCKHIEVLKVDRHD